MVGVTERCWLSAAIFGLVTAAAVGAVYSSPSSEQWVTTWATAQPLYPEVARQGMKPPPKSTSSSPVPPYPNTLAQETVRMIVRVSTGGDRVRIELANREGGGTGLHRRLTYRPKR